MLPNSAAETAVVIWCSKALGTLLTTVPELSTDGSNKEVDHERAISTAMPISKGNNPSSTAQHS